MFLDEEVQDVRRVIYDRINSDMVREAIKKTRVSAGTSGLDVADWCRMLTSRNFGTSGDF